MAKIPLSNGFSIIPEGFHIFRIFGVEYNAEFGNLNVYLINAKGQTHRETFRLKGRGDTPNEGAMNAFSYFAKTAMNDYSLEEIEPDDLVGKYIGCEIVHTTTPSTKPNAKPGEMVTFVNLGRTKTPATGFTETATNLALTKTLEDKDRPRAERKAADAPQTKPEAAPAPSSNDLDDLLGL